MNIFLVPNTVPLWYQVYALFSELDDGVRVRGLGLGQYHASSLCVCIGIIISPVP